MKESLARIGACGSNMLDMLGNKQGQNGIQGAAMEAGSGGGEIVPFLNRPSLWLGLGSYFLLQAGGCKKHNFWTTPVRPAKNYIFGILGLRAIDWYMHGSDPRRGGVGGG